ncbi:hypothetical protein B0H13DRAFT_2369391 [Mycena leptocephala]|nr:hypothetical protein B0H13DRAFT_2369391 [Mycena leptocephala]
MRPISSRSIMIQTHRSPRFIQSYLPRLPARNALESAAPLHSRFSYLDTKHITLFRARPALSLRPCSPSTEFQCLRDRALPRPIRAGTRISEPRLPASDSPGATRTSSTPNSMLPSRVLPAPAPAMLKAAIPLHSQVPNVADIAVCSMRIHRCSRCLLTSYSFPFLRYAPSGPLILGGRCPRRDAVRMPEIVPALVNEWPSCNLSTVTRTCIGGYGYATLLISALP